MSEKLYCAFEKRDLLKKRLNSFSENDFKVKLGSLLEDEMRIYYVKKKIDSVLLWIKFNTLL
jgi:hypothetical protein